MVTVKHDVLALRSVRTAVIDKNTSKSVIIALVVVSKIILIGSVVALVSENGIIYHGIVNLNPAHDLVVYLFQLVPVD